MTDVEALLFAAKQTKNKFQISLHAPKDSVSYKNSVNGTGNVYHRFTFSKIFNPNTEQEQVFSEMVLPKLKEFIEGRNQVTID